MKMNSKNRMLELGSAIFSISRMILLSSYLSTLLIFVPYGIAVEATHQSASVVFAINAVAIIPLSSLLPYATKSVASTMGDTVGALMNVPFGNAIDLVILYVSNTSTTNLSTNNYVQHVCNLAE